MDILNLLGTFRGYLIHVLGLDICFRLVGRFDVLISEFLGFVE